MHGFLKTFLSPTFPFGNIEVTEQWKGPQRIHKSKGVCIFA